MWGLQTTVHEIDGLHNDLTTKDAIIKFYVLLCWWIGQDCYEDDSDFEMDLQEVVEWIMRWLAALLTFLHERGVDVAVLSYLLIFDEVSEHFHVDFYDVGIFLEDVIDLYFASVEWLID